MATFLGQVIALISVLTLPLIALNPAIAVDAMTGSQSSLNEACNPGWSSAGIKCYKLFDKRVTWHQALTNCHNLEVTHKPDLASIHNGRENALVKSLMGRSSIGAWIGLADHGQELRFFWTDGSKVDFTDWRVGESNSYLGRSESCVELRDEDTKSTWNDLDCSQTRFYICQQFARRELIFERPVQPLTRKYKKSEPIAGWSYEHHEFYTREGPSVGLVIGYVILAVFIALVAVGTSILIYRKCKASTNENFNGRLF